MKTLKLLTLWFIGTIFFISCGGVEVKDEIQFITFVNNSTRELNLSFSADYPDTTLTEIIDGGCGDIKPNSTNKCQTSGVGWKDEFGLNPNEILLFFVSDVDTIRKYGAEIWRKEYKILKRYDLTISDMESMNWTITYP